MVAPTTLPGRSQRVLGRKSRLLFHWNARDLSLTPITGEAPTFVRATAGGLVVGSDGRLRTSVHSQPRFEWYDLDGDGVFETVGLLLEGLRINKGLQAEDLTNATWLKTNTTIAANDLEAPDGELTEDRIVETATTTEHLIEQNVTVVAGSDVVTSFHVRADERTKCRLRLHDNAIAGDNLIIEFDLTAGTILTAAAAAGAATLKSFGIRALGNSHYRIWIGGTLNGTVTAAIMRLNLLDATGTLSYLGDVTKGMHSWGEQLEEAAFPSSYIPTVASSVTRDADVLTYPFLWGSGLTEQDDDFTVYAKIPRPTWADAIGALETGIDPGIIEISSGLPRLRVFGSLNASRNHRSQIDTATTDVNKDVSIPAGDPLELSVQYRKLRTGGETAIDTGTGLSTFGTGATAFAAFGDTVLAMGDHSSASGRSLFGAVIELKVDRRLSTLTEMQESF